ncbi:MAG TPA: DUF922 domain-containing protein [Aestuariivirgaceae bacterium]
MNTLFRSFAIILAALPICAGVQAIAQTPTNYVHYLVAGNSAQRLFESMISNGPRVGGGKAYASTRMDPKVLASTESTADQCRVASFKLSMNFTIRLPQLENDQKMSPELRQSFERFYIFAKRHEETHRAIWLQCAAEAEAMAIGITAPTCAEAEAKSLKIVEDVSKSCDKRHAEFDAAEQKKLSKHPFLRQALFRVGDQKAEAPVSTKQRSNLAQGALAAPQ